MTSEVVNKLIPELQRWAQLALREKVPGIKLTITRLEDRTAFRVYAHRFDPVTGINHSASFDVDEQVEVLKDQFARGFAQMEVVFVHPTERESKRFHNDTWVTL